LKPVTYYNKLPSTIDYSVARIFILDPMLATGGSAVAAVDIIKQLGTEAKNITVVSVISAPEGISHLAEQHPGIRIFTGAVDERLNDKAYIVPGLGDAGDRTFRVLPGVVSGWGADFRLSIAFCKPGTSASGLISFCNQAIAASAGLTYSSFKLSCVRNGLPSSRELPGLSLTSAYRISARSFRSGEAKWMSFSPAIRLM
jgi:hypothetical protein